VVDRDDEVIIPTPYWVTYSEIVKLAGGKVVHVKTTLESGFKITPEQLEKAITPATRLFMFSSPCNPTGSVYTKGELEGLATVFARHPHVFIMSDEIYELINFSGRHVSIASFPEIKERVILINGLSKGFAMTGYRIGYLAAAAPIAKACDKIQGQFTSGVNAVTQRAAITALNGPADEVQGMVAEFRKRRDRVMDLIKNITGMRCPEPPGAFYVFPDVSNWFGKKSPDGQIIQNADDLSMYLLHAGHVTVVTGAAFGEPNCIRISFANSVDNIENGFARIKKALEALA